MAVLVTADSADTTVKDVDAAARALGLQIQVFNVSAIREIDAAFATFARERPDALFVSGERPACPIGPIGGVPPAPSGICAA